MHYLGLFNTVFIPDLSSGTWLGYFQRFGKIYCLIEIQVTGQGHICGIRYTEEYKYYEFTKGNIDVHGAVASCICAC